MRINFNQNVSFLASLALILILSAMIIIEIFFLIGSIPQVVGPAVSNF